MKLTNADKTEFRVGLKSLFDLYPARVREKLINECRNKVWDEPHRQVVANVMREIESFDLKNVSNLTTLPLEEKLKKENLDASIEILNFYEKKFSEFKTTYDCILYPTSDSNWTAVIDLTETVNPISRTTISSVLFLFNAVVLMALLIFIGRLGERACPDRIRQDAGREKHQRLPLRFDERPQRGKCARNRRNVLYGDKIAINNRFNDDLILQRVTALM